MTRWSPYGYSRTAISDLARAYEIHTSIYRGGTPLQAPADAAKRTKR